MSPSSGHPRNEPATASERLLTGSAADPASWLNPAARRWWPRTLTNRLVLGAVGLAFVLVVGVGAGTFVELRQFRYHRLDQQLAGDTDADHAGFYFSPRFDFRGSRPAGEGSVWAIAFDSAGHTVAPNPGLAARMSLNAADTHRLAHHLGAGPTFVTTMEGNHLRVQVVSTGSIQSPSGDSPATVAVGLSIGNVSNTLRRLLELELLVGIAAILFALLATTYGVRRSLRRLHRVTRLAWDVSADLSVDGGALRRRVPTSDMYQASEVGQLATSVNTLLGAVEAQVAERARNEQRMREFLLDASHELRTPLTSIRGYAELARMYRQAGSEPTS
jgi:two-component system OmpR family sensor kinase